MKEVTNENIYNYLEANPSQLTESLMSFLSQLCLFSITKS